MKLAVFCSGRGSNLKALLMARDNGLLPGAEFQVVVTDNKGAGAMSIARDHGVMAVVVPRSAFHENRDGFERRLVEVLEPYGVELVVLAGFQRVLGATFLGAFPNRVVNIHPALLPAFPGHMVWKAEVDYGVRLAGATVHFVDGGVDSGPIIIQGAVPALSGDGPDELAQRILSVEHRILPQAVAWLAQGRVVLDGRKVSISGLRPSEEDVLQSIVWPPLEIGK
ncbi:MAG: phosphoribosylglycinamide formyltransferase [Deltaproteobacteria bacterium]|jgi:phosphoribosylglycinamide formyltransferase-1|nr:phosphoribosylglycinamide formyltransferase [Deltaproteobacteria bacterium]